MFESVKDDTKSVISEISRMGREAKDRNYNKNGEFEPSFKDFLKWDSKDFPAEFNLGKEKTN